MTDDPDVQPWIPESDPRLDAAFNQIRTASATITDNNLPARVALLERQLFAARVAVLLLAVLAALLTIAVCL